MPIKRRYLYIIAALIWGAPGLALTIKGIAAYYTMPHADLWWLLTISLAVLTAFYLMFRRIVDRYSARIAALPDHTSIWQTFPPRGWALILLMMCIGIALKHIPSIPTHFTASFYTGLGPMLIHSAIRFLSSSQR